MSVFQDVPTVNPENSFRKHTKMHPSYLEKV
jgi:hypothetical protein